MKATIAAMLLAGTTMLGGCGGGGDGRGDGAAGGARVIPVTIEGAGGKHVFRAELARTEEEQERGLMFRTGLAPDFGMLFAPYPPNGGPPVPARFWMKDTPSPLDIIFIRADGTIARIADNAIPFSQAGIESREPVTAVLEVPGGRTAELGIGEGDRVTWPKAAVAGGASAR